MRGRFYFCSSIFVGSVPRTDRLGNGPYISQRGGNGPYSEQKLAADYSEQKLAMLKKEMRRLIIKF